VRNAQAAEQLTGTLQKIKDTGVITLGVRDSSIPFNYNLGGVRQVGYSYDINMKIVEAIKDQLKLPNLQVKEIPITSQNRITLLQNGTIDIECGSTTNNRAPEAGRVHRHDLHHRHAHHGEEGRRHQGLGPT
jgi:glutamate/aspartate transport system substrate-binding protein